MTDPINHHPHSRYTLHEKANLYPFRDLIWGKTDGPFIDLKVDVPDPRNMYADGTAFLRVEDVVEMAHCLGMATLEEVEALKAENESLKALVNELPNKVGNYIERLSALSSDFIGSLHVRSSPVAVAGVEDSEDNDPNQPALFGDSGEADSESERDNRSPSGADGASSESGNESAVEQGPDDVPSSKRYDALDPLAALIALDGK